MHRVPPQKKLSQPLRLDSFLSLDPEGRLPHLIQGGDECREVGVRIGKLVVRLLRMAGLGDIRYHLHCHNRKAIAQLHGNGDSGNLHIEYRVFHTKAGLDIAHHFGIHERISRKDRNALGATVQRYGVGQLGDKSFRNVAIVILRHRGKDDLSLLISERAGSEADNCHGVDRRLGCCDCVSHSCRSCRLADTRAYGDVAVAERCGCINGCRDIAKFAFCGGYNQNIHIIGTFG